MNNTLRNLLAAGQIGDSGAIFGCIVSLTFVLIGVVIMLIPAKQLLKWDGRSGYWIYQQELKASGDEQRAVAKAAFFYKVFGACFIVLGSSACFMSIWTALQ